MSNLWKAVVIVVVIAIAAIIVVPKMVGTNSGSNTTGTGTSASDGSSLPKIERLLKNGKPTLLLLRSST